MESKVTSADARDVPASWVPATVFYEQEGCVMGTWRDVAIAVWGVRGTLALTQVLDEMSTKLLKAHPRVSSVQIIVNKAPLPDSATRAKMAELTQRVSGDLAAVGSVLEGSGFWASALQSFLTSLYWFQRRPFEARVCGSIAEVSRWLPEHHHKRTGTALDPAELEWALTALRNRVVSKGAKA
jgi:hypothetical protein